MASLLSGPLWDDSIRKQGTASEAVRNDALQVLQALMDGILVKDKKRPVRNTFMETHFTICR